MNVLVIGDSCQDVFIYGKCDRLCPDAPVPVFIPQKTKKMGGMAMNVYENLKSLSIDVEILTNKKKVTKTRFVDEKTNQMIIRVDSEKTSVDRIKNIAEINLSDYDAIIISDYNKGYLTHDDIKYICDNHEMVFVDTKKIINENFYNCKFIKINEYEYKNNISQSNFLDTKMKDKLIVTVGSKGTTYKNKIFPVEKVEIKDMVGAGDTFISCLVYKFLLTNNIKESIRFANECSTIVVQQKGVSKIGDFLKIKKL
jgi:D-beta-D-heptose 7-phosphate kinase/D-beta-D-heptose 1-phosphate adenosyltransferase